MRTVNFKNSRRFAATVMAMVCAAFVLTGCGGSKEVTADVTKLGADLAEKITYQDTLTQMDAQTAAMYIDLSAVSVTASAIYESSGATAEEIIVLECASASDAAKAADAFKTRVADQKESFTDYVPEELTKLGNAVIATSGKYAVLSVSDDADTAKSIISEYLK